DDADPGLGPRARPDPGRALDFSPLDHWIRSRLQETIQDVTQDLTVYEPERATERLEAFLDDLSNWYLRRSRRRFWAKAGVDEASDQDKHAAYTTLYEVLVTLIRLLAPFTPFVVEAMYQNLVRMVDPQAPESVHHTRWPEVDPSELDLQLLKEMRLVQKLVSLGHAARNQANRKLRQPLREAAFAVSSADERKMFAAYKDLLAEELNVKGVRLLDTAREAVEYHLNPLPKQLGQKYGAKYPAIRKAILALDPGELAEQILRGESFDLSLEGETLTIMPDEVEVRVEAHEGFSAVAEGAYLAALVTDLDEELVLEGLAREFVRRVQDLRKQADFQVDDHIAIQYSASQTLDEAIKAHQAYIQGETIADRIEQADKPAGEAIEEHTFDEETLTVAISRLEAA
ncbi:MAG: DUF5915 domain-containing protein, partial [Anaerolineales bacterium]